MGAINSTKISGNFGPKLNGSVRSNRKSFEKTGPPFEVVLFSRSDRLEFWLNGSRPRNLFAKVTDSLLRIDGIQLKQGRQRKPHPSGNQDNCIIESYICNWRSSVDK